MWFSAFLTSCLKFFTIFSFVILFLVLLVYIIIGNSRLKKSASWEVALKKSDQSSCISIFH